MNMELLAGTLAMPEDQEIATSAWFILTCMETTGWSMQLLFFYKEHNAGHVVAQNNVADILVVFYLLTI